MNKLISLTTIAIFGLVACAQALLHKTTSKSCPGRKSAPSSVGWNLLFGSILVLFFVPWLDTSRVRSARFRPIYRQFYWLLVVDCMLLKCTRVDDPPEGVWLMISRFGAAYYFLHFLLVLPLVGLFEKTQPLPASVAEPVLSSSLSAR